MILEHGSEQNAHDGAALLTLVAARHDLGHDRHLATRKVARHLDGGVVAGLHRADLLLDDIGLGGADGLDLARVGLTGDTRHLGIGFCVDLLGPRPAIRRLDRRLRLEVSDGDLALGIDNLGLRVRDGLGLLELLASLLGELLGFEGDLLLLGELPVRERLHQLIGRNDVADERVHRSHIVLAQCLGNRRLGLVLTLATRLQEADDIRVLRRVAKVVADRRLEHLRDEVRHAPEPRDHLGCIAPRDVDDLRYVEVELETIRRTDSDGREVRVELVGLRLAGSPVEHDVGRRHILDLVREGVDGILARVEWIDADALLPLRDEVAMLESVARDIDASIAHVGDNDADIGDRHLSHRLDLDGDEQWVDKVAPSEHHLLLQTLVAAGVDELLAVLVHAVPMHLLPGDLAGGQRLTLLRRHDADHVVFDLEHAMLGDGEESSVDPVGTRRDDRDLRTTLAAPHEELPGILERIALDLSAEHTTPLERMSIARLDDTDTLLSHGDELDTLDLVLPRPEPEVQPRSERIGLETCLTVERDDRAVRQGSVGAEDDELLVDDTDGILGNDDHPKDPEHELVADTDQDDRHQPQQVPYQGSVLIHASSFPTPAEMAWTYWVVYAFFERTLGATIL